MKGSFKTEVFIWAFLSLLLTSGYAHFCRLGLVGYLLGILLAFSLTIFFWRSGWLGLVGAVILTLLFYMLRGENFLIFLFKLLLPALILSIGLRCKKNPALIIFLAVVPHLVILGITIAHYSDIVYLFRFQLQEIAEQAKVLGIDAGHLGEKIVLLGNLLLQMVFGFQLLSSLLEVFLVYLLVGFLAGKLGWDMVGPPAFYLWQSGQNLAWVFVLSFVLLLVGGKFFEILSKNILLVFGFWYAVLGFSVSEWFLKRLKSTWLRTSFYFLVLITQVFSFVFLSLVGFFDSWLDFRGLSKKMVS